MNLRKCFLVNNDCYKSGVKITPKGIMVHSTGANNPNLSRYVQPDDGLLGVNNYKTDWNQARPGGRQVCVHAFIGKLKDGSIATYQTLPFDIEGWHSGSGKNGSANSIGYIGFEICEDGLTDSNYFNKVYKEAVEFTAYLCNLYKLDPMTKVICHSEGYKLGIASNHGDVMHWFPKHGKNMDIFRNDVKAEMSKLNTDNKTDSNTSDSNDNNANDSKVLYRVQVGAYKNKGNAVNMQNKLKDQGIDNFLVYEGGLYKVQCGAFSIKENAIKMQNKLKSMGYSTYINVK